MPPAAHTPDGRTPPDTRVPSPSAPAPGENAPDEHTAQGLTASLLGGWNLVDHTRLVDGQVVGHPLGPGPLGRLEYRPDGRMSALLMRRDRPWPDGLSFTRATDEQRGAAALGFVGYAGRYTLRGDLVLHHVEMSLYVEHVGDVLPPADLMGRSAARAAHRTASHPHGRHHDGPAGVVPRPRPTGSPRVNATGRARP